MTIPLTSNRIRDENPRPALRHIHRRIRPGFDKLTSHNVPLACTFSGVFLVSSANPGRQTCLLAKLLDPMHLILWERREVNALARVTAKQFNRYDV